MLACRSNTGALENAFQGESLSYVEVAANAGSTVTLE